MKQDHAYWMKQALVQAGKAFAAEEIPVGAIVVKDGKVIGRGYNQREQLNDPTAHAEVIAITAAANTIDDWRLTESTLYVTKEPCPMCAGAIVNARIRMVVFGCYDEEAGCCGSLYQLCSNFWRDGRVWLNAPHSKCGISYGYRGFKSLSLRIRPN